MNYINFSGKYRVRLMGFADVSMVVELCTKNTLFYQFCPPFVTAETVLNDMKALPPRKTYRDKYYLGYFDEKHHLVAVMDFIDRYPDPTAGFIGFFMVELDKQGSGVGSAIIAELCDALATMGYRNIRLGYVDGNEQSKAFWQKNCFVDTGLRNKMADYTVVVMNRSLTEPVV